MFKPPRGQRKFRIGLFYLCSVVSLAAIYGPEHWTSLAALAVSMASGVGVVVWGNVKFHQANGSGG